MAGFECRDLDAAGRTGRLEIPSAGRTLPTPALMPVVNPHVQTLPPARLTEIGADILITNAYVLHGSDEYRSAVLDRGIHDLLDFDGVIMTDSGSFQLAEYGEIDVTTPEILEFQARIGSDIATPIDIPTPPDAPRDQAEADLKQTQKRLETAVAFDAGDMLVTAPIQGSTHLDLREQAAAHAYETGLDVFPIGAVVPLMKNYRFADMIEIIAAAKRGLGADAPVHLFGAGHPMMFALAVALGCDLFDSAAYALYARDGRYLTVQGTEQLADLVTFPCACPVCTDATPDSLQEMDSPRKERLLAEHNLHVSFAEMRRIRQAIRTGNLLELVEIRARGHPRLLDGYRTLLDYTDLLEQTDPVSKGTFFYVSTESATRPEVQRYHDKLERLDPPSPLLLTPEERTSDDFAATWDLIPPFGPVPPALAATYPLTAELPERTDEPAYQMAATGIHRLLDANPTLDLTIIPSGWPDTALNALPSPIEIRDPTDNCGQSDDTSQ